MDTITITDMTIDELVALFSCNMNDADFYDVVAYNICLQDPEYLIYHINYLTGKRLRSAIFGLGFYSGNIDNIIYLLNRYLGSNDPLVVSEIIYVYTRIKYISAWDNLKHFISHESPFIRSAMLKYSTICLDQKQSKKELIEHLKDCHYLVRESAIDELGEIGLTEVVPYLLPLLDDPHKDVRDAAKDAISSLDK